MILIVSRDDAMLSEIARDCLTGHERLRLTADGDHGLEILSSEPGLSGLILDLDVLGAAAFELCRAARARRARDLAIVIVGSLPGPHDRYESFASGASDFMLKPVDALELKYRLRAHRSAGVGGDPEQLLVLGDLRVDLKCGEIQSENRRRTLTPHEAAILRHLAARIGRCVPTEELLVEALGYPPRLGNPEVVRTHIRHLRQKLEPDPTRPRWLVNVPRVGYRISAAS